MCVTSMCVCKMANSLVSTQAAELPPVAGMAITRTLPTPGPSLLRSKRTCTCVYGVRPQEAWVAVHTASDCLGKQAGCAWDQEFSFKQHVTFTRLQLPWYVNSIPYVQHGTPVFRRSRHPELPDLLVPDWADSPEDFVRQHR